MPARGRCWSPRPTSRTCCSASRTGRTSLERFEPPSAEGATLRTYAGEPAAQEPPRSRVTRTLTVLERVLVRRETGPVAGIVILAVIFQVASGGGFLTTNELSGVVTLGAPLS